VRILILGGTGFVGGALARRLLEGGHAVAAFHRGESSGGAETIRGDRAELSEERHREAFRRFAPDAVVDTIAFTEAEARGLIEALRGIAGRYVVLSSQDVYAPYGRLLRLEADAGAAEGAAATEDSPLRASRHPYRARSRPGEMAYDYDKVLVEAAVRGGADAPVTILRLPMVYGPGDPYRRLRPLLAKMVTDASEIRVDRARAGWRWTRGFVEDVADAIALATTDPRAAGRVYNLGEEDALAERDWIREVGEAAGWCGTVRAVAPEEIPEGEREPIDYDYAHDLVADTTRIRRELGFRERVGRAEGLRRAVAAESGA
jgi:nucleoside-diphosphate-sugar epimerase